jgi:lipopolysaccharide/colanic/teichoic acid biosynthesis glycosyltransferase
MSGALLPIYFGIAVNSQAYAIDVLRDPKLGISRALMAFCFTVGAVLFLAFNLRASSDLSRFVVGVGVVGSIGLLTAARFAFGRYVRARTDNNPLSELTIVDDVPFVRPSNMAVLHADAVDLRPDAGDPVMVNRLASYLKDVDRVIVACSPERRQSWSMLLKGANVNGELLADEWDEVGAIGIGRVASGGSTLVVSTGPLDLRSRALKRVLDLVIAVPVLIMLAPLLILTAIAIKIDSPGPVFFLQKRFGRGNRLFRIIKFRSMRQDLCDANGNRSAARDDDRITRVGWLIRKTSIDELPQLLNVLKGEMSLVGPRPHALGSLAGEQLFWEVDERYWHRHASKPGITGLAQIRGYRGATHKSSDLRNRLHADLEYLVGWSVWRDISILVKTFGVLVHRNAY